MIDLDVTLFIQLANFLITLVVLNALLIRPVREIIRRRRETADGLADDAEDMNTRASRLLARYEDSLRGAREEGAALRQKAREEAEGNGQVLLAAAGTDAHATLGKAREATKKAVEATRERLRADVPSLSKALMEKLTGGLTAAKQSTNKGGRAGKPATTKKNK